MNFTIPKRLAIDEEATLESLADLVARLLVLEGLQVIRSPEHHLESGRAISYSMRGNLIELSENKKQE